MNKPRLKLIEGAVVAISTDTPKIAAARQRHGKIFAHESGSTFRWQSGPSVLNQWLHERRARK